MIALLRIAPDGKATAEAAFHKLGTGINALRLWAEMIQRMYGEPFGPADTMALLKDLAASTSGETVTSAVHTLSEHLPLGDIPAVLDGLPQADLATRAIRRNE